MVEATTLTPVTFGHCVQNGQCVYKLRNFFLSETDNYAQIVDAGSRKYKYVSPGRKRAMNGGEGDVGSLSLENFKKFLNTQTLMS